MPCGFWPLGSVFLLEETGSISWPNIIRSNLVRVSLVLLDIFYGVCSVGDLAQLEVAAGNAG